jgi:hypothetical protein
MAPLEDNLLDKVMLRCRESIPTGHKKITRSVLKVTNWVTKYMQYSRVQGPLPDRRAPVICAGFNDLHKTCNYTKVHDYTRSYV